MSIRPVIIVGCGGSGGKVVQLLRQELESRLTRAGWQDGIPKAWQLLYLDTPASQETGLPGVPPIPMQDYISVSGGFDSYDDVVAVLNNRYNPQVDRLIGWMPRKGINIPLTDGAGQMRAVGRATSFSALRNVSARLESAFEAATSGTTELGQIYSALEPGAEESAMVSEQLPYVFVITSLAGGTGAGIFMDVCDVFRTVEPRLSNRISGVLFSAEVFKDLISEPGLQPNSLAAFSEVMAGTFNSQRPMERLYTSEITAPAEAVGISGPAFPYIVGTSTMGGTSIQEVIDCYRATTQTLAAVMLNPDDIGDRFTQYQVTNWDSKQSANLVGWSFGNQSPISEKKGVFSSFGSATLSVGVRRFQEYATRRIGRMVVDFQTTGWQSRGHDVMQDPQASIEEVVEFLKLRHGPEFISQCHLHEAESEEGANENNQIIDQLCNPDELNRTWTNWRSNIVTRLQNLGAHTPAEWRATIEQTVANREQEFTTDVNSLIAAGREQFVGQTPTRILEQTTLAIAEHGIRVARGLLEHLTEDLHVAQRQLQSEAIAHVAHGREWRSELTKVFEGAPKNIPSEMDYIPVGVRIAAVRLHREAGAEVRQRGAEIIEELIDQVISPLILVLRQIEAGLGGSSEVQEWPGEHSVPDHLAPPPLEFCLVSAEKWPQRFNDLLSDTASHDDGSKPWQTTVRTMVGAGGFTYVQHGRELEVTPAIELARGARWSPRASGGDGTTIQFQSHYEIEDVIDRAEKWVTREGTAIGNFLAQGLMEYMSATTPEGVAIEDHSDRLNQFAQCFEAMLRAATPMIEIAQGAIIKVHPQNSDEAASFSRSMEPLPLPEGHPAHDKAREVVQKVLGGGVPPNEVDVFFGNDTSGVESATCVSILNSAIHPSAITSLVGPITQAWNSAPDTASFWMRRRSRRLDEFIPVHPPVLQSMIRGWVTGRMLGLIPNPTAASGFSISGGGSKHDFPWPLVQGYVDTNTGSMVSWLPWILETLPLAFARLATEPKILGAYDELYLLGQSNSDAARNNTPREDYPEPTEDIATYIRAGQVEGAVTPEAVTGRFESGDTSLPEEERRRNALSSYLDAFIDTLERALDDAGNVTLESQWELRAGFDLFPRVISAAQELHDAVAAFGVAGQDDVG